MNKGLLFLGFGLVFQLVVEHETVASEKQETQGKRPNFLLLLTDDQSYHLSLVGTPGIETPNMDALAKSGVFFTKAYSAAASCSPCRSSILTGMYPHSNGHWRNTVTPSMSDPDVQFGRQSTKADPVGVHEDLPTLIELLNANGYTTGITEKFHLSPPWKFPFSFHIPAGNTPSSQYQAAIDFLNKSKDKPFFLEVNIGNTHRPWRSSKKQTNLPAVSANEVVVPPNWPDTQTTREDYAEYLTSVEGADAVIGEVLRALTESGLADNTIIIYTSDQGFCYHRAKASTYDWGVHIPLSFTGMSIQKNKITDNLANHIDFAPTILDFAGILIPKTVQGKSLKGFLEGKTISTGEKYAYSEHNAHGPSAGEYYPTRTVTDGRFRYIRNLRNEIVPDYPIERFVTDTIFANKGKGLAWTCWDATTGGAWGNRAFADIINNKDKFPVQYDLLKATFYRPHEELYDLQNDPYEMENLAGNPEHTNRLDNLRQVLDGWILQTKDDGDPRSHARRTSK